MKTIFTICAMLCCVLAMAQPANDQPCNAIAIIVDEAAIDGTNVDATADANEVIPPAAFGVFTCVNSWCGDDLLVQNSVWYSFIAPATGAVTISTCNSGSALDSQIALWSASDCNDYSTYSPIAANDDIAGTCSNPYASSIEVDGLTSGATYLIQVDGYTGESSPFLISVNTSVATALVNFVHASADPAAQYVDVRVNGEMLIDNFSFLTCSGLLQLAASSDQIITLHDSSSADAANPLLSYTTQLNPQLNYEFVITGQLATNGFSPTRPLAMMMYEGMQLFATQEGSIPVHFIHAVSDAPSADFINAEQGSMLVNDISYGNFNAEGYLQLSENFTLAIQDSSGTPVGLSYCLPVGMVASYGIGYSVIAIGFLNPSLNSNGSPLQFYSVDWTSGSLIPLDAGSCLFPSNDGICTASELIVNDAPTTADNSFATIQANETSPINLPGSDPESDCSLAWCDGSLDNTLWFNFTAPASGSVLISTCFGGIDTQVALCTVGNCTDFATVTYLGANDDMVNTCADNAYASEITTSGLTPGETYYIQTDGFDGELGTFQIQVTSIEIGIDEESLGTIAVYPNPANDFITIPVIPSSSPIRITNALGAEVLRAAQGKQRIDVSALDAGVYFVQVELNGQLTSARFIKQ
jgi:hypothetical protein